MTVKIQKGQKSDLVLNIASLLKSYDHSLWENNRNVFYLQKSFFHRTSVYSKLLHHNCKCNNLYIYIYIYIYLFKK